MNTPLHSLVRFIGTDVITKATEDRFLRLLIDAEDEHPVLDHFISHLAAGDTRLLEAIASAPALVAAQPGWVLSLLRHAYRESSGGKQRTFLRRLAAGLGWSGHLPDENVAQTSTLTPSQASAFTRLRAMAEVFFEQEGAPPTPVKLRLNPLIVGPSGTGKSHLAHLLGEVLGVRVICLSVSNWIPEGARQQPTTLELIRDALDDDAHLIIFVDELDKFRAEDSGWVLSQMASVFALLDRRVAHVGGEKRSWTATHTRRLREKTFIVGAGAWQNIWNSASTKPVGFRPVAATLHEITDRIRTARVIPDEILNRFSRDWLVLAPYTANDFASLAGQLGLPMEVFDPRAAAESGRNYRYIEDTLTAHAVEARLRNLAKQQRLQEAPANAAAIVAVPHDQKTR